jgi:uncharacterized membrane protein YccF (DUF307 family)
MDPDLSRDADRNPGREFNQFPDITNNKKSNAKALSTSTFKIHYLIFNIFLVLRHSVGGAAEFVVIIVDILPRSNG